MTCILCGAPDAHKTVLGPLCADRDACLAHCETGGPVRVDPRGKRVRKAAKKAGAKT